MSDAGRPARSRGRRFLLAAAQGAAVVTFSGCIFGGKAGGDPGGGRELVDAHGDADGSQSFDDTGAEDSSSTADTVAADTANLSTDATATSSGTTKR